jgi:hypothetical protein
MGVGWRETTTQPKHTRKNQQQNTMHGGSATPTTQHNTPITNNYTPKKKNQNTTPRFPVNGSLA